MADTGRNRTELARDALEWLLVVARERGTALEWTTWPGDDEFDPTLYSGTAGIVLALLEGYRHYGDDRVGCGRGSGTTTAAAAARPGSWP